MITSFTIESSRRGPSPTRLRHCDASYNFRQMALSPSRARRKSSIRAAIIYLSLILPTTACVTTPQPEVGREATTYVGIVRVDTAAMTSGALHPIVSISTTTIGARVQSGLGLGVFHERQIYVPLDCRFVVFVRTSAQLQNALDRLSLLTEDACVSLDRSL
jgi:hypothetical protein